MPMNNVRVIRSGQDLLSFAVPASARIKSRDIEDWGDAMDINTGFLLGIGAVVAAHCGQGLSAGALEVRVMGQTDEEIREARHIAVEVSERPDQMVETGFTKTLGEMERSPEFTAAEHQIVPGTEELFPLLK
ncbi:MAG: hypothetical protein ACLQPD_35890 [Desulfomonilaceae bacterium]